MVDVTHWVDAGEADRVGLGQNVTLLGPEHEASVVEWARIAQTIPYEIMTSITAVPRVG